MSKNIIEELGRREAASAAEAKHKYADLVARTANGENVNANEAEAILARAGKSASEFSAHVGMAKRLNERRMSAAALDLDTLAERNRKAIEQSHVIHAECRRLEEEEIPRRKREADIAVRVAQSDLARGGRVARELAQAETEFDAAINGTPIPETKPAPMPRASATSTPGQHPAHDPWTHDTVLGADGKAHYVPKNRPLG
jgi:hypothetical protein